MLNFYLILFFYVALGGLNCSRVNETSLTIGDTGSYSVDSSTEYIIQICNLTTKIEERPPRISMQCLDCTTNFPILVVVRQQRGVLSWTLPYESNDSGENVTLHKLTSRTLCPFDIIKESRLNALFDENHDLSVSLSTLSQTPVHVTLKFEIVENFVLELDRELNITVSPSTPQFYHFKFPDDSNHTMASVLLRVRSDDDKCLTVSVQNVECPVHDFERNVALQGYWQSVTRNGGITVTRSKFPNGFYAVFLVRNHDEFCERQNMFLSPRAPDRDKVINIAVVPTISVNDYIIGVASALGSLAAFCLLMATVALIYMNKIKYPAVIEVGEVESVSAIAVIQRNARLRASTSGDCEERRSLVSLDSTGDAELLNKTIYEYNDETPSRSKGVFLSQLARKHPVLLARKAQRHLWYLTTVAIFYFLPVLQLVITYQEVLHSTGNQNLCYYNFLCAHPIGLLSDFNHVFSNVGYVVLGLLFILLTWRRQCIHRAALVINKAVDKCYGIPQNFGLYYAMGTALAVEGVMSSCYHVCPNNLNFQFDTSFMYVMSALCMIKIYHSRHPDHSAGAYAVFAVLAGAIFFGMYGILEGNLAFWCVFTVVHLVTCFAFSLRIYYLGTWRLAKLHPGPMCQRLYGKFKQQRFSALKPTLPSRFVIIVVANAVNWALAVMGPKYKFGDFGGYLLMIFMVNLMIYCSFYIIMKIVCKERIGWTPGIFIVLSIISWTFSLIFFNNRSTSWKLAPAKSREFNQPCRLLDFYDNHDIWHFLSAASMFFSFMVLLTLDDDLQSTPRDQISVF